jgi:hypothetical protein
MHARLDSSGIWELLWKASARQSTSITSAPYTMVTPSTKAIRLQLGKSRREPPPWCGIDYVWSDRRVD